MTAVQWRRRGLLLFVLLLLAGAYGLQLHYQHHHQELSEQYLQQTEQMALDFEQMLSQLQMHVRKLQQVAQLNLHNFEPPRELLQHLAPPEGAENGDVYTLDRWQQHSPQAQLGNVFLLGNPTMQSVQKELRVVEALFPISAANHLSDSALQWSYYTSFVNRLTSIFPYRNYQGLLEDAEVANLATFYERYLPVERRRQAIAELATVQAPIWRPPHRDRAGAGWVIALSAPVRHRGEVLGAVSTDVRLSFLSMQLARQSSAPERTMILDEEMRILADSRQSVETATRLEHWLERMPVQLQQSAQKVSRDQPGWVDGDGMHFLTRPLANSQWIMVRMIPTGDLFFEARVRLLMLAIPLLTLWLFAAFFWYRYGMSLQERQQAMELQ